MHAILLAELDRVVRVLDLLEACQLGLVGRDTNILLLLSLSAGLRLHRGALRLVDAAPHNAPGQDLVVRLQNDEPVLEVLEQVEHAGLDAERVEPERENAGLAFALRIEVLDDTVVLRLLLVEGLETRVRVEEVGDEGKVKTWVTRYERCWREVFPATDVRGVLKDLMTVALNGNDREARR